MKSKIAKASRLFLFLFLPLIWVASKFFDSEKEITVKEIFKEWKITYNQL